MKITAFAITVSDNFGVQVNFSRLCKNFPGGVKIHKVGTTETVKCIGSNFGHVTFQFLCISIL